MIYIYRNNLHYMFCCHRVSRPGWRRCLGFGRWATAWLALGGGAHPGDRSNFRWPPATCQSDHKGRSWKKGHRFKRRPQETYAVTNRQFQRGIAAEHFCCRLRHWGPSGSKQARHKAGFHYCARYVCVFGLLDGSKDSIFICLLKKAWYNRPMDEHGNNS